MIPKELTKIFMQLSQDSRILEAINVIQNYSPSAKKVGADFICIPLSRIFLDSGSLPRDWVTTNIVPAHKKGDKHLPSNYRPISLTSIVVKAMERIIHHQLSAALESNKLFSESQLGFRNKHSTITLLVSTIDDWATCLERRNSVHCLLLG